MVTPDIEECEKAYIAAAQRLDSLENEVSEQWVLFRSGRAKSDQQATQMTNAEIGPYWNQLRAQLHITKLRLEAAYAKSQEGD